MLARSPFASSNTNDAQTASYTNNVQTAYRYSELGTLTAWLIDYRLRWPWRQFIHDIMPILASHEQSSHRPLLPNAHLVIIISPDRFTRYNKWLLTKMDM
jgi:hypothetical protein